jgi:hypothetical protein
MKYAFFILILYSCFSSREKPVNATKLEKVKIDLQSIATIRKGAVQIPINFKIINIGSVSVYLNNPCCWGSLKPIIIYDDNRISPTIKVRIDPECAKKLLYIGKGDTVDLTYSFSLDQFINLGNLGKYELLFEYSGTLFNEDKKKISYVSDFTNKITFYVTN